MVKSKLGEGERRRVFRTGRQGIERGEKGKTFFLPRLSESVTAVEAETEFPFPALEFEENLLLLIAPKSQ